MRLRQKSASRVAPFRSANTYRALVFCWKGSQRGAHPARALPFYWGAEVAQTPLRLPPPCYLGIVRVPVNSLTERRMLFGCVAVKL